MAFVCAVELLCVEAKVLGGKCRLSDGARIMQKAGSAPLAALPSPLKGSRWVPSCGEQHLEQCHHWCRRWLRVLKLRRGLIKAEVRGHRLASTDFVFPFFFSVVRTGALAQTHSIQWLERLCDVVFLQLLPRWLSRLCASRSNETRNMIFARVPR